MTPTGTYLEIDGRPALRFERRFAQAPSHVWTLLTDPDELATWFPMRVHVPAWEVGAPLRFTDRGFETHGRVRHVEEGRRLGFDWEGDELWFDLAEDGGGTVLTFTTILGRRDTAARNAAGWDVCLDALAGRGPTDWSPLYDGYVAAGVPAGAPIPG